MLTLTVVGLGLFAGITIYIGMPVARRRATSAGLRSFLGMFTAGILLFLFWDILTGALLPVVAATYSGAVGPAAETVGLALGGFALAYLGLSWFERMYRVRVSLAAVDLSDASTPPKVALTPLRAMNLIAIGIGLHNFAEGLAIGTSYVAGGLAAATLLFVGFAVHNSTEGFGVVGPAMAAGVVPSWRRLGALGLVAGGPTLLGTIAGSVVTPGLVASTFLAIAAGAILYVVLELVRIGDRREAGPLRAFGLFAGFAVGLLSDLVLIAAHI
jgi:zinc transporter, ZIP family